MKSPLGVVGFVAGNGGRLGLQLWAAVIVCLYAAPTARAQDQNDPAVIATARELAVSGVKAAQEGRCSEAVPELERAEKLHHSQIVLTRLGDCYIKLGQLTAGIESLRSVLREPLIDNASETLKQAYTEASQLLEANKPKLAKLTIRVSGLALESTKSVELTIDKRPMPSALLGAAHVSDPGEHIISVSAPGYVSSQRTVSLAAGGEETVVLPLNPDPEAQAALQRARHEAKQANLGLLPSAALTTTDRADSPSHWPAYLTWGVSAAAIGVGVGFGFAALDNRRSLDQRCMSKVCPSDAKSLLDNSKTNAAISTVAYVAGIAGAAAGVVLFWLESRDTDTPSEQASRVRLRPDGVSVTF
jgi:uncharacterized protein YfiM (DUF2279 family)